MILSDPACEGLQVLGWAVDKAPVRTLPAGVCPALLPALEHDGSSTFDDRRLQQEARSQHLFPQFATLGVQRPDFDAL